MVITTRFKECRICGEYIHYVGFENHLKIHRADLEYVKKITPEEMDRLIVLIHCSDWDLKTLRLTYGLTKSRIRLIIELNRCCIRKELDRLFKELEDMIDYLQIPAGIDTKFINPKVIEEVLCSLG